MAIQSLAVFCGSKTGTNPIFQKEAAALGKILAEHQVQLIFGGGSAGLMGVIADSTMKNNGQVTGIIPKMLLEWEVQHREITELRICNDMHERKRIIYSICDAAMVLPGGFGTLDEFFEILTWNQLTIHDKETFILNSGGFYRSLLDHIAFMRREGFLYEETVKQITVLDKPEDFIPFIS